MIIKIITVIEKWRRCKFAYDIRKKIQKHYVPYYCTNDDEYDLDLR